MDFKEEFEFKPLSEGLGFHPRKNKQNSSSSEEMTADFEATTPLSAKNTTPEKTGGGVYFLDMDSSTTPDEFFDPPPAKKSFSEAPPVAQTAKESLRASAANPVINPAVPTTGTKKNTPDPKKTVDDILSSMKNRNQVLENKLDLKAKTPAAMPAARIQKSQQTTQVTARTTPYGFQAVVPSLMKTEMSFTAAFLDGLLVVASGLICLIILLSVTRMDLIALLTQSGKTEIYFSTFMLFAVVSLIYLTATRVFLGSTPGEWAFDQQAGTDEDQQDLNYMFKVISRSVLVIGTGFILFPIASFAMAKDLLGDITGVHLYTRK